MLKGAGKTSITQLAVIGAGPAGYTAAFLAADQGFTVTLIDLESKPGGVCLHHGCIPSKALLHTVGLIEQTKLASMMGLKFSKPKFDLAKIRAWKDGVVNKMALGLASLCERRKIRYLQGRASFLDARTLKVQRSLGDEEDIAFEHAILASGSRPASLPDNYIASPLILNSKSALTLGEIPKTLLVIGAGYIGLELSTIYAALGAQVTLVENKDHVLASMDSDLVALLARGLKNQLAEILTNTQVTALYEHPKGMEADLVDKKGGEQRRLFEKVLVAIGRRPNSSGMGLSNTKVEMDAQGFVKVDARMGTHEPTIYAIGDVAGEPMLAHKAAHQARVAVAAMQGKNVVFEPRVVPAVVYTHPEIAWCGLTETEAKEKNITIQVTRLPWAASGRATTLGLHDGLTKMIFDPESARILGVAIVGAHASELISEAVLAIEMGATAEDVALSIHPHPTLAETLMEAAELYGGTSPHVLRKA